MYCKLTDGLVASAALYGSKLNSLLSRCQWCWLHAYDTTLWFYANSMRYLEMVTFTELNQCNPPASQRAQSLNKSSEINFHPSCLRPADSTIRLSRSLLDKVPWSSSTWIMGWNRIFTSMAFVQKSFSGIYVLMQPSKCKHCHDPDSGVDDGILWNNLPTPLLRNDFLRWLFTHPFYQNIHPPKMNHQDNNWDNWRDQHSRVSHCSRYLHLYLRRLSFFKSKCDIIRGTHLLLLN